MRKFKIFFYPIYIIIVLVVLYFSIDILSNMEAYKEKIPLNMMFKDIPVYLLSLFIFLCLLMMTEIIVENSHIISLKRRVSKAEKEALNLKAKLYDQSQVSVPPQEIEENESDEEEDEHTD